MIIKARAYPRAGLIGNPSDGYFGKTIAFCFRNYCAEVTLYQTPELEILPNQLDHSRFDGIAHLAENVKHYGYYGGIRLLKASIKRFHDYCRDNGIVLDDRNFTIRYHSDIPHRVGLAGSSAIITACFRALMAFYQIRIPREILPNLVLEVEMRELGLAAGLQDRVVQAYQGVVYMDFDRDQMASQGHGRYEALDPALLPPLYIAYRTELSEGSEVFHNDVRVRFNDGEPVVVQAMRYWADLTAQALLLLREGRGREVGPLLDANFDKRCAIYRISEGNRKMVEAARSVGASAKFSGSGGAIVGTYRDDAMFSELKALLEPLQINVFKPDIITGDEE